MEDTFDLTQTVNGKKYTPPSPYSAHQEAARNAYDELQDVVRKEKLGKMYFAPLDVYLDDAANIVQPDLFFIRTENLKIVQDFVRGVPDLVVEIISRGSYRMDNFTKKELYAKFGVKEYWLINPLTGYIEIFALNENGEYYQHSFGENGETVTSKLLNDLTFKVDDIIQ